MSIKNLSTENLFDCVEKDLDMLDDGSWVPDSSSIEDTRTVLLELKARMLGDETGGDLSIASSDPASDSDAEGGIMEPVLRRYPVRVNRVAYSSDKTIRVLAVSEEDASARALELAHDMNFSCTDSEYKCSVSCQDADALKSGDVVTWRDPADGEEQDVIFRESYGEIVLCHTLGGGEVEVFPHELH